MLEEITGKKRQVLIERGMLFYHFVSCLVITIFAIRHDWSIWLAVITDLGWLFSLFLHLSETRSFMFRAYVSSSLMLGSMIVWSISTGSLALTVPALTILAVLFVFYGIPEIIYMTVAVTGFLSVYHLCIGQTVDLSSTANIYQTFLQIYSVFFIEYIIYMLNKKSLSIMEHQMETFESLKDAERSKDDFMANVSHEIRTPINTICGMSEIVLREELPDQVRADVFSIQTAGRNLQSIVSDVLDFTEMQTGKMSLVEETYNITSTINDVINMSMARKSERNIELIVDCDANLPVGLIGDEQKIRRIIMNLVNNALKFTEEGCVSIVIGARKTDYGVNLVVRIKDTGIGMKKESMEKLFSNFNQVDTRRNRQKEGIGLGLAISQALVDMMGGFITVSSEFGKGSEIQFVIPQQVADATPIAVVRNKESVNVAIYVNMERYERLEVREAYSQVIYHMIEQLKVKSHICQNLSELKRRAERETFTHVFIGMEEYGEDQAYFDNMSRTAKVAAIVERFNETRISNPDIRCLYKPLFLLPIVMVLNDEKMRRGMEATYQHQGKFIAPDVNVLVVDDNLMNIRVLEGLLRPYQISVAIATSGAEALEKIDGMGYDVVFMDHMMPEMDGIETFHRIRQKQGNYFKKIPVVAVTANAVGGMHQVFLDEGFQDFIAKPIEVSVLERVLRRILPQEKLLPVKEAEEKPAREAEVKPAGEEKVTSEAETEQPQVKQEAVQRKTDLPADTFDEAKGIVYCGNLENYIEILRLISDKGQEDYDKISHAYELKTWKDYAIFVHALKSTMRSVGVEKLSDMAKELELAGKHGNEEYILGNHDAMMVEYMRVLGLLEKSATVYPEKSQEDVTDLEELEEDELDKLALEFEDAAFAFDHEQMAIIAEYLSKCSYRGHSLTELMQPIMKKIEMQDYLSASEAVARLKDKV